MKLLFSSCLLAAALFGQQNTVFRRDVFQGITTAQASVALPNIGQAVHLFTLIYPAASADVTGFTFRVEASFDNTTYFPISEDITEAKYNGSFAYAISRCNGVYPYVRFRLVTANASNALTAHYTGSLQPIGIVRFSVDRYIADSPLAGTTVTGPGQSISGTYYVGGRRMTPITPSEWTTVNSDVNTTRFDDATSITLYKSWTATDNSINMVCRSLPAAPYTIRVHVRGEWGVGEAAATQPHGVMLRNSTTGQLIVWEWGNLAGAAFRHQKYNSPTSFNSTYTNQNWQFPGDNGIKSIEITDDNTNRAYLMWNGLRANGPLQPNSVAWGTRVPRADFTTPDQICAGVDQDNGNYNSQVTLLGYDVNPTW